MALLIGGVLVLVVGGLLSTSYLRALQERAEKSDAHLGRARHAERAVLILVRTELHELLEQLGLNSNGRVSLFLDTATALALVGRYSAMPTFDRTTGRAEYPYDEGVIGKAWEKGAWEEPRLSNPGARDAPANPRWIDQQCGRYNLPRDEVQTMTMRSRSYAAIRLECGGRLVGVLIAEDVRIADETPSSDRTGGHHAVSVAALNALSGGDLVRQLSELLGRMCDMDHDALRDGLRDQLNRPSS
ncbi:MAG: hypothetical protein H0W25_17835 [Acidimicrobiia bacterium]|nr:hypothetical protein [Acidimicrobiia bacterium]